MDEAELDKLKLEALRALASDHGIAEAPTLGRGELIAKLAHHNPSLVERARHVVAHAVERVEGKAHELAERIRHHKPEEHGKHAKHEQPPQPQMGVPSSTVHPHGQPHPDEPTQMLDFEELPETYGVDECEVVARDPHHVFAWWEVTDAGLDGARAQLGQSAAAARLVMRLFTTVPADGHVERELRDVELHWNHGRRYLQSPRAGAHLRIAVGLLSTEGYFAPIAHSSLIRVPPDGPQPGTVEWMEVVPARRGRGRDPLIIVRRGAARDERGLYAPRDENVGGSSPTGGPGGASPTKKKLD